MSSSISAKKLLILANPHSPHISVWLRALENTNISVDRIAINHGHKDIVTEKNFRILFSKTSMSILPKILMYFFGGIFLFFKYLRNPNVIIHAHCASGYGLMAFLSGKKYALTTYGSEIFDKDKKGAVYNFMMTLFLKRAYLITASSPAMKDFLVTRYKVDMSKIRMFSLGVSKAFLSPITNESLNKSISFFLNQFEFVFLSNRRITPHYNIDYILHEFKRLLSTDRSYVKRCGLLLLSGDYDSVLLKKVKHYIEEQKLQKNIMIVDHFIEQKEMSSILENVNATVSMANSDQLSASILESISKGAPPILNKLEAYTTIQKHQCGIFIDSITPGVLTASLKEIICKDYDFSIYEKMEKYAASFLKEKAIHDKIFKFYHEFI